MSQEPPQTNSQLPYENLLQAIVSRIQSQPLLFVVAVIALIIAIVVLGGRLGSADFRYVVGIIAGLAVVGMAVYYVAEARRSVVVSPAKPDTLSPSDVRQTIDATGGSKIYDAEQEAKRNAEQTIKAADRSTIKNPKQKSG